MANSGTPLLTKRFNEGCPGCVARKRMQSEGLPMKQLVVIAYLVLVSALPICSLYPFIYFMVQDMGIAKSDTNISTYAGFVGAAYMLGRFTTGTVWGVIADKYGRKPVLVIGTFSIIVFNTLFGFSSNFWLAVTWRAFLGLSNGVLGTMRAYVSEICSEEHQATGLSTVGSMWGIGLVIGPAIGGYLAQPAEKYPSLFPSGSLFDLFPYALPCLLISMFAAVAIMPAIWLPESLHKHLHVLDVGRKVNEDMEQTLESSEKELNTVRQAAPTVTKKSLLKNRALISSICVYCLWSLHTMAFSEIFSLWAVSPTFYGGLGLSTSEVGDVLAAAGAALLLFQLSLFAKVEKLLGPIQIARVSGVLTLPLVAIYPLISNLRGVTLWTVLISAASFRSILSICFITGNLLWINNSVVSARRGLANGVSMTFMSLFKAIGPACAGFLLSWSQQRMDASFLPGMWMVFTVLDVLCLIACISTFEPMLPSTVKQAVNEDMEEVRNDGNLERAASFTSE